MTQHRIDNCCGLIATDDGGMWDEWWDPDPSSILFLQADQLKLAILKNDQIQCSAKNHQLISLVAMTEKLGVRC